MDKAGSAMGPPSSTHHDRPRECRQGQPDSQTGRYRSAPQVFSMAQQTLRSIERGLGPPTLKDAFTVEDLASVTCHPHSGDDTYDCTLATIVCCWWMLRGIEVAAAKREHVWFETTPFGRMAFFTLPCHKTDTVGMCVTRSHPCMCADGLAHLCPYHTLEQYIIRTTTQRGTEESFLFPGLNGGAITHEKTIQVFRTAIEATGAQLTRPGPQGQLDSTSMCAGSLEHSSSLALATPWRRAAHWSLGQRCGEALCAGYTADMRNGILITQSHRQPHSYTEGGPGHGEEVPRGHLGQVLD